MKWLQPTLFALALAVAFALPGHAAAPKAVASAEQKLRHGAYAGPATALIEARAQLERLAAAEPKSALLHYYVALADWRLVPRMNEDKKKAKQFCMDGIERCDRAVSLDPKFAEAVALKAALQGYSIQFDPASAMTLGPEMEASYQRALKLAPENPRVHFLQALNTLHKPEFVGGGAKNASPQFAKALELFEKESASDTTGEGESGDGSVVPRWGYEDAYLWAGQTAMKLDDPAAARGYYQHALEINPENGWIRGALLPEAEAKLKGKEKS